MAVHACALMVHIIKDDEIVVSFLCQVLDCLQRINLLQLPTYIWKGVYEFTTAPRAAAWITEKSNSPVFLAVATRDGFIWKICPEKDFDSDSAEQKYVCGHV